MAGSRVWLCAFAALAFGGLPAAFADERDHDFTGDAALMRTATQAELAEIELSRIAERSAASAETRDFAAKMVHDHSVHNSALAHIALKANVPLPIAPDSDHMHLRDDLIALRGKTFDKAYVEAMRNDHHKMVEFLTAAMNTATNDDLRHFIKQTLPVVQHHLHMAESLRPD